METFSYFILLAMSSPRTSDLQLQFSAGCSNFSLPDGVGSELPDINFDMLPTTTTGHNSGHVSGSGSGQQGENEAQSGSNRIWEPGSGSGSGSGLPEVNNGERNTPAAVAVASQPQAIKKRAGKGAEYSRKHRNKKKELEEGMKLEIEKLRKENKDLRKSGRKSNRKLDGLKARIEEGNERYTQLEQDYQRLQSQVDILIKNLDEDYRRQQSQEKMSLLQEENKKLKTDNDRLTQRLNADTEGEIFAKKSVKIPLENTHLKIKRNVLHLKRLD